MPLELNANERLVLDLKGNRVHFQAVPLPSVDGTPRLEGIAHVLESGRSKVFHLQEISESGAEYALKIMRVRTNIDELQEICKFLKYLRDIPGLECCDRFCLATERGSNAVRKYPDLESGILMPWLHGATWFDAHASHPTTRSLSKWQCLNLAIRLADILATLEAQQLSHCNLSPQSIIVSHQLDFPGINLIGVEDMFGSHLPQRATLLEPVPEYRHSAETVRTLYSDRFPGALLLGEILSWYDEDIKDIFQAQNESLFTVDELHDQSNPKFASLCSVLDGHHNKLTDLMRRAWLSPTPEASPPMSEWLSVLEWVSRAKIEYAWLKPQPPRVTSRPISCWEKDELKMSWSVSAS